MTIPAVAQAMALFGVVLALAAGLFYFVRNWSSRTDDDRQQASSMLSIFRDVHSRGGLSDSEYRTIKGKLAPELKADTSAANEGLDFNSRSDDEDQTDSAE